MVSELNSRRKQQKATRKVIGFRDASNQQNWQFGGGGTSSGPRGDISAEDVWSLKPRIFPNYVAPSNTHVLSVTIHPSKRNSRWKSMRHANYYVPHCATAAVRSSASRLAKTRTASYSQKGIFTYKIEWKYLKSKTENGEISRNNLVRKHDRHSRVQNLRRKINEVASEVGKISKVDRDVVSHKPL